MEIYVKLDNFICKKMKLNKTEKCSGISNILSMKCHPINLMILHSQFAGVNISEHFDSRNHD